MADQQQEQQEPGNASSTYVGPPDWFRLYAAGPDAGPEPPEPLKGEFFAFGEPFDTNQDYTPRLDVERIFDTQPDGSIAIKQELLKLNKGLLFLFLELLTVLVQQPSRYAESLGPVLATMHNMQYLINLARPLQAKETLRCTLQTQIQEKQAALTALRRKAEQAKQDVTALTRQLAAVGADAAESMQRAPAPAAAADGVPGDVVAEAMDEG
eukprot:GHUV01002588.1.p2 GENE.GHUV01002588.1~~GHUV01002588.1.p2  ORF type:complete len:211 (+),score=78.77 GHUV01002588.1:224-856(+)